MCYNCTLAELADGQTIDDETLRAWVVENRIQLDLVQDCLLFAAILWVPSFTDSEWGKRWFIFHSQTRSGTPVCYAHGLVKAGLEFEWTRARDLQQKQCASVRSGFGAFFLTIRVTASSIGTSKLWHHCVAGKCCRLHQIATIGLQGLCDEVRCKTFSSLPDCFWVLEGLEWQFCSSSSKAKVKWMECSGFQN